MPRSIRQPHPRTSRKPKPVLPGGALAPSNLTPRDPKERGVAEAGRKVLPLPSTL